MREVLAAALAAPGAPSAEDLDRAASLLQALGVAELVRVAAVSERIVLAADGFHAVAGFFVEGSEEREYILGVLRRARRR